MYTCSCNKIYFFLTSHREKKNFRLLVIEIPSEMYPMWDTKKTRKWDVKSYCRKYGDAKMQYAFIKNFFGNRQAILLIKCIPASHLKELYFMGIICAIETRSMTLHYFVSTSVCLSGVHNSQLTSIIHKLSQKEVYIKNKLYEKQKPPSLWVLVGS